MSSRAAKPPPVKEVLGWKDRFDGYRYRIVEVAPQGFYQLQRKPIGQPWQEERNPDPLIRELLRALAEVSP